MTDRPRRVIPPETPEAWAIVAQYRAELEAEEARRGLSRGTLAAKAAREARAARAADREAGTLRAEQAILDARAALSRAGVQGHPRRAGRRERAAAGLGVPTDPATQAQGIVDQGQRVEPRQDTLAPR